MWIVVYVAKSREIAENLRLLLEEAGLPVKIRPVSRECSQQSCSYDILVPDSEVAQAHSIIIDKR